VHFSLLSLVMCLVVATAAACVWCFCWLAARRRRRHHDEWARLSDPLRDLDVHLDRVWAAEKERTWRHP
jgi:hypothetical protein